jgi:hypothetical protein
LQISECSVFVLISEIMQGRQLMRKIDRQSAAVLAFGWFLALLVTLT